MWKKEWYKRNEKRIVNNYCQKWYRKNTKSNGIGGWEKNEGIYIKKGKVKEKKNEKNETL